MKDSDVIIGMKVIPYNKTSGFFDWGKWREFIDCPIQKFFRTNGYLFVTKFDKEYKCFLLDTVPYSEMGDFFNALDFKPYIEK